MVLEKTLFAVEITESDRGRAYFASQEWAHPETRSADIIIAPWEKFRAEADIVFPQGTADFYKALAKAGIGKVAIAALPENYQEIALHARTRRWPTIVVTAVLLPALAGFLGDLAHDAVSDDQEDTVQMEVIVEADAGKSISIKYTGPSGRLVDTLLSEAQRCLPGATDRIVIADKKNE